MPPTCVFCTAQKGEKNKYFLLLPPRRIKIKTQLLFMFSSSTSCLFSQCKFSDSNFEISLKKIYLKYFSGFEESCVLAAAEREQHVQGDPPVLLLEHHAVPVPGASGGPRGARRAATAFAPCVLDQTLLPAGERRRLRRAVRLHFRGKVCACRCVSDTEW